MSRWGKAQLVFWLAIVLACAGGAIRVNHAQGLQVAVDWRAPLGLCPQQYGTNAWWSDQDTTLWRVRYTQSASNMFRVFVSHAILEPVNDNGDPNVINWDGFLFDEPLPIPDSERTVTYRDWFEALGDSDITVLLCPLYLAPWLSANGGETYPPNDLAEYQEFVVAVLRYLVNTMAFPPEKIILETMNEPDLRCGQDPVTPCFWQNWTMQDIADVVRASKQAAQAVDPAIHLAGVAECCGTGIVESLLANYPQEGGYLDGLSYHYYAPSGYDIGAALNRGATLKSYGRPVYLDEYGSFSYQSEGVDGALWHSHILTSLWEIGISPLQYPFSEWVVIGEPYNSMGLFHDWRGDWEIKPAYWVYANFYHHMGGTTIVSSVAPSALEVIAAKKTVDGSAVLSVWVTNLDGNAYNGVSFQIYAFPSEQAMLEVYDCLEGLEPIETLFLEGPSLVFDRDIPARSSQAFVLHEPLPVPTVSPAPTVLYHVYLPLILKQCGSTNCWSDGVEGAFRGSNRLKASSGPK